MLCHDKFRQPVSILDIGSGGGDMLRKIWRWARRSGHKTHLTGVDLNPWAKKSAESLTPDDAQIEYETSDIFSFDPNRRADFIISSLFTNHLTDSEIVKFLRWTDRHATRGWFYQRSTSPSAAFFSDPLYDAPSAIRFHGPK